MKNLIFVCLILTGFSLFAQEKRLNWDYPVKPGDKQWVEFKTSKQMLDAVQIPQNILEQLSTVELAELCLNYPLFFEYTAVNDGRLAISFMIINFNGLNELSKRKDGAKELMNLYEKFPMFKENTSEEYKKYSFKLPYLELLLSNDRFLTMLDEQDIAKLKKLVVKKYGEKLESIDIYGLYHIRKSFLLGAAVLNYHKDLKLNTRQMDTVKSYLLNYRSTDRDLLTQISKIISEL